MNDEAKRRLLRAAASYMQGAGGSLEDARLSELQHYQCIPTCGTHCGTATLLHWLFSSCGWSAAGCPLQMCSWVLCNGKDATDGAVLDRLLWPVLCFYGTYSCAAGKGLLVCSSRSSRCCTCCSVLLLHAGVLVPPTAEQRPQLLQTHDDTRTDKYYW